MIKIDIRITQDIRKYKPKDIGNFSLKEVGIMIIAAAAGYAGYKYLNCTVDESIIFCAGPLLVVGFIKPFGLSLLQFIKTVFLEEFATPRIYYNESDFEYNPDEFEELLGEPVEISSRWDEPEVSMEFRHTKEDLKQIIK